MLAIKFRVEPMIYFGSSNHKLEQKKTKWRTKSKWPLSINFLELSKFLCKSIEPWDLEIKS
jgi:hypothetical protein